jgi:hypothetical protein
MDEARAAEGLSRIQDEINAEKAAALSRIAGTLEALLAELRRIAAEAAASQERERAVARHREVREQALRYRWYLEVQREAIGLTRHEALDEMYPVPEPLEGG